MPKRKPAHGGRRAGAGRKPSPEPRKVSLAVRVSPEIREYLDRSGNRSATVEAAVRAYRMAALEADGLLVRLPPDAPPPECE